MEEWGGGLGRAPGAGRPPAAPGLPFAGIPSELQAGVDRLVASEPEYEPPTLTFEQNADEDELKRLTLWSLLTKYPGMLVLAGLLVVVISVAGQVGPKLTEYAINYGMGGLPGRQCRPSRLRGRRGHGSSYVVFIAITALAQRFQVKVTGRLAAWVMNDLRVKVFAHLQRLSLGFFTERRRAWS